VKIWNFRAKIPRVGSQRFSEAIHGSQFLKTKSGAGAKELDPWAELESKSGKPKIRDRSHSRSSGSSPHHRSGNFWSRFLAPIKQRAEPKPEPKSRTRKRSWSRRSGSRKFGSGAAFSTCFCSFSKKVGKYIMRKCTYPIESYVRTGLD